MNAAEQRRKPQSLLNWTERIIRMRKEVPELGWGDFSVLDAEHPGVLAMRYDWRNNSVVTLHNLTRDALSIELHLGDEVGRSLVSLLDDVHSHADGRGRHHVVLEPFAYHWYRVGGLGHILERSSF